MENSGLNEKNTTKQTGSQEKTLRIVQMYFANEKENKIMKEISHYITMLEDYVNKKKTSKKTENKLISLIKENKKTIRRMDTYLNTETQTEGERNSVKDLQDNSSESSLYPPRY